jgi:hypothetical protein
MSHIKRRGSPDSEPEHKPDGTASGHVLGTGATHEFWSTFHL